MRRALLAWTLALVASTAHAVDVSLAWDASASSGVAGYRVYYGTAPGVYTGTVDAGPALSVTVAGLANGATYYFAAKAYNANTESEYSNEVALSTPADPSDQGPVTIQFADASVSADR